MEASNSSARSRSRSSTASSASLSAASALRGTRASPPNARESQRTGLGAPQGGVPERCVRVPLSGVLGGEREVAQLVDLPLEPRRRLAPAAREQREPRELEGRECADAEASRGEGAEQGDPERDVAGLAHPIVDAHGLGMVGGEAPAGDQDADEERGQERASQGPHGSPAPLGGRPGSRPPRRERRRSGAHRASAGGARSEPQASGAHRASPTPPRSSVPAAERRRPSPSAPCPP